jgi:hypothetical protein
MVQGHTEVRDLRNASYFGLRARHSRTFLKAHVTLNVNNNMSTEVDIERAFDITWHSGFLSKLHIVKFSTIFFQTY